MSQNKLIPDLNCDLGEGMGNDALLMPFLGSCSIACGGHVGNGENMLQSLLLAKELGVKVGAHPSFPDKINFGRVLIQIEEEELYQSLLDQIKEFKFICDGLKMKMYHIKAHGALYNHAAKDPKTAALIVRLIKDNFPDSYLYCPPKSEIFARAVKENLNIKVELFADRTYQEDFSLLPRSLPNALLTNPKEVLNQVKNIVNLGKVRSNTGKFIPAQGDTLCIHGDNPNALEILKSITEEFDS
ncbi:hypothetical protein P872_11900 [Rhodonellum psychrophilum GCM71 = DSM 17998]|uniref:LamB/YcsF family protein n=2 Tax=Rhodonellum TaxID=336827 RepID=U5BSK3_9BACT|nr:MULTISPECIES: LamB/YcsF family protein [Rhodonellum]ERM80853.1 hypothetical protein P872_11900 [Rhodonellum psychrophilum GCM71 = DSM 17998]SDZ52553.1 UPF0271 protein [Rhodonellum ikkaensis]